MNKKTTISELRPVKTIVLANNREFFSPIDEYVLPDQVEEFVECDYDEADMDLMLMGDDKIVVTQRAIDPEFMADITKLFGYKNFQVITPVDSGKGISVSLMKDKTTLNKIIKLLEKSGKVNYIPWGTTREAMELYRTLAKSIKVAAPECPIESGEWVPDYGNTKVGTREILANARILNKKVTLAENYVAVDMEFGRDIAKYFISKGKGVVFKANLGVGGIGVNVFPPSKELKTEAGFEKMMSKIARNGLFNSAAFVVEEYIYPDIESTCAFPSIEALVNPDGSVVVQEYTAMVIDIHNEEITWHGIGIGKGIFTLAQTKILKAVTEAVGKVLFEMGYRGWINLDFIHAKTGEFYCSEVNVRMSPARYMIELSRKLFGKDYDNKMAIISDDKFIRPYLVNLSYQEIKNRLASVMYPINGEKRGVIITETYRSKFGRGKFGYVSIGKDFKDATGIVASVKRIFK